MRKSITAKISVHPKRLIRHILETQTSRFVRMAYATSVPNATT